jgi:F0F1-type ATP synthase membrane subunit b/b'
MSETMVEIKDRQISAGLNELEKTFQEYKKKLEDTEQEAQQIVDSAREKADTILKENQNKAQKMADEIRQAAKADADKIIAEADAKVVETETMIQEQMNKAQKMADDMIQAAKDDSATRINETGQLIDEVSQKVKNFLNQFQTQMQSTFAELITKIDKAKDNPDTRNIMTENEMKQATKSEADKVIAEKNAKASEAETMIKEQTSKAQKIVEEMMLAAKNEAGDSKYKKNDSDNFKGQYKFIVIPPYNEVQTKELIELLKQIPGIKIDSTSAMEDNFLISLRIVEAIPLKRILSSISLVESSEVKDSIIKLKLKRYKIGGLPYY